MGGIFSSCLNPTNDPNPQVNDLLNASMQSQHGSVVSEQNLQPEQPPNSEHRSEISPSQIPNQSASNTQQRIVELGHFRSQKNLQGLEASQPFNRRQEKPDDNTLISANMAYFSEVGGYRNNPQPKIEEAEDVVEVKNQNFGKYKPPMSEIKEEKSEYYVSRIPENP